MKLHHAVRTSIIIALASGLAACGGGGSDSGTPGAVSTPPPSSGTYGWILRAVGSTAALKYGLSLIHPSQPDSEYVVEIPSSVVSDAVMVSSGSVNPSQLLTTSLVPYSLIYVVGGDVRSVPLQADGTTPISRVQRAQSTSACTFVLEGIDHAAPLNSRFIVSTAGADGQCSTGGAGDDGRAEVRSSATGALIYTPISGDQPIGLVRDAATLAPRGWIYPRSVVVWGSAGSVSDTTVTLRPAASPAITSVVASTYRAALVDDGTQLSIITFAGGTSFSETPLGSTTTGGGGWNLIGFDAANFFVYRNSGTSFTSQRTVLKISRADGLVTVLSTGTGLISVASMGKDVLYLTVFAPLSNSLVRLSKAGGAPVETVLPTTTLTTVLTSASGVHEQWKVTGVGSSAQSYTIDIVDEAGTSLYTSAGGFPMSLAEPTSIDANSSESRTRFLFAGGYGERGFGNASLISYDASNRSAIVVGSFPGTAEFGSDFVFATTIGGPSDQGLAFAARSSGGSIQASGAKLYSYDLSAANSFKAVSVSR